MSERGHVPNEPKPDEEPGDFDNKAMDLDQDNSNEQVSVRCL